MTRSNVRNTWRALRPWQRHAVTGTVILVIVATCFVLRRTTGPAEAAAQVPAPQQAQPIPAVDPAAAPQQPSNVAAVVNGVRITRDELAQQCLWHFGEGVLDGLVNRTIIADFCVRHNIVVTKQQVDEEIDKMAERFAVPRDEWLKMLEAERGVTPHQYANDIIWPTVALKLIAASQIQPTEQEITQAYETQFGPAVQCRLIALNDMPTAQKVHSLATSVPDEFGNLAKTYSADVNSASAKGLIQPIRKHMGDPALEQAAFALEKGAISPIIPVGQQFVILKCEQQLPARQVPLDERLQRVLTDAVRDKKLRLASTEVFGQIKAQAQVDVVFADPQRRAQEPEVAARVNGKVLGTAQLADECLNRHGKDVLEAMIGRTILTHALQAAQQDVAQQDVDAEIARAALSMGKTKTPGGNEPDIEGWIKEIVETQKIPFEQYVYDSVWPSVALKKLVAPTVQVTEEDLQKGFEANYGPRVKCRAIVHNQMRKAQEVWQLARDNPTVENFGMLAEQYSVDSVSRALRGEVPPIQKHGGQPILEKEAFALKPGELSGIIQVDETFVILYCEGMTKPRPIEFAEVRDLIYQDVHEKKMRQAMAKEYARLQQTARIDNFIAGKVQSPTLGKSIEQASQVAPGGAPQNAVQAGFEAPVNR
ncbi:MAG: peptidylprolyl isomerase [Planctomycetales bacterium]|nr:peptidylprolyl isomerase [Planctomycetales bacterium]